MDEHQVRELQERVRELSEALNSLRENVSTRVHEALTIARELHQSSALLLTKLEVRGDTQEEYTKRILTLLQGDGGSRGLLGRTDLLEQALERLQKATEGPLAAVSTHETRIHNLEALPKEAQEIRKEVQELKTEKARIFGGWQTLGIVFAALGTLFAVSLQLYSAFWK